MLLLLTPYYTESNSSIRNICPSPSSTPWCSCWWGRLHTPATSATAVATSTTTTTIASTTTASTTTPELLNGSFELGYPCLEPPNFVGLCRHQRRLPAGARQGRGDGGTGGVGPDAVGVDVFFAVAHPRGDHLVVRRDGVLRQMRDHGLGKYLECG